MPLHGQIDPAKTLGIATNIKDEAFHLIIKPPAKYWVYARVILCRLGVFVFRRRMKAFGFTARQSRESAG